MKKILFLCTLFSFGAINAQLNMDSISHVDYNVLHATAINDVWGYEDEIGNEYALVGTEKGTSVVDISSPSNPIEIFWEPGMESIWRDLKTYGDYAFVTTEAQNGLLIIDLSPLPASTSLTTSYYSGPTGQEWFSAHNLYISNDGYAYIFGANRGNGGVIILDVHTDPMNPIEVGVFDDWYTHDGFVLNDTLFLANIDEGFISMVDVTNKSNPFLLGTKTTPSNFAHNVWALSNGDYVFTTDEVSDGYIGAYDVTDPSNIKEIDRIQSSPGAKVIPHNTHVLGNHLITSYYSDGVVIHDVTYPYNMVEVGHFDTYPTQTTSYDGCWGAYPFFSSGIVLSTDVTEGLFILNPTYVQAAYLEGIVTDANTSNPLGQVDVQILAGNQIDNSRNNGFYATGIVAGGNYNVTYSKVGYFPQTINVNLTNGIIVNQDVQLIPIPPFNLNVKVVEVGTGTPLNGAEVRLIHDLITHEGVTNGIGQESLTLFYQDDYKLEIGKWGYMTHCSNQSINNTTGEIIVELKKMIWDDFTFDFGWSVIGSATTGIWERGIPNGTSSGSAPSEDVLSDCGEFAYVTGNTDQTHPDVDDVDRGFTVLISPVIDLSTYTDPYVNYSRWFYCFHGPNPPDDTLRVLISNGIQTVEIDKVGGGGFDPEGWIEKSIRIKDFISLTISMQLFFRTSDLEPNGNVTEAALDKFFIVESNELSLEDKSTDFKIYPNPFTDYINVEGLQDEIQYQILSLDGSLVKNGFLSMNNTFVNTSDLKSGVYLLNVINKVYRVIKLN